MAYVHMACSEIRTVLQRCQQLFLWELFKHVKSEERINMGHASSGRGLLDGMQLLTEKEVSRMTAIPTGTLRRWRCVGSGPNFIKMGNGPKARVKYDSVDIHAYVEAGRRYPSVRATQEK
jgi:hypothetical protein